jgi:ATP-dependent Lhr-like helicase
VERDAGDVVPTALLATALTPRAARAETLARHLSVRGPVTARELVARYGFDLPAIEGWLAERQRSGRLVTGRFRAEVSDREWCSRRLVEVARRRALAVLRRQIAAVTLPAYAAFLQRWQHVDPRVRLDGAEGARQAVRQLYGTPRPGASWERDVLPARLTRYDTAWLSQLAAGGELVWAGEGKRDEASGAMALSAVRFLERGTGRTWLRDPDEAALSDAARAVLDALVRLGASFLADLQAATNLGSLAIKEALRELVAAGLVTNDAAEAMREVVRAKPMPPSAGGATPDPTRWLPADYTPSPGRRVVQRRPNLKRLPKWRRPDRDAGASWTGRWTLLRTPGTLGPELSDEERAERVAWQWLERYGVVSRDWWARERPPVSWRSVYYELRRLELRGEVRRGYFVEGLAGAQFALPDAVERLREEASGDAPYVAFAVTDPANPYALGVQVSALPPLARPRGAGGLLVTHHGAPVLAAEGRGKRVALLPGLPMDAARAAAEALVRHLLAAPATLRRGRDVELRTIDGAPAAASPYAEAFRSAGFRHAGGGALRFLEPMR